MPNRDIIVVGTSADGVSTLSQLVRGLPADIPAAIFIVLHLPAFANSSLPRILSRAGPLPASHPKHKEPIQNGHIYVAPPDRHLLIRQGEIHLSYGPRENNHRPAVDPLFRSAAQAYGSRVIGVILSGALDDGAAGLRVVKLRHGIAVVQDPNDALYSGMPRSAIQNVDVDYIPPLSDIPPLLVHLARETVEEKVGVNSETVEVGDKSTIVEEDIAEMESGERPSGPSVFTCPDCSGVL